MRKILLLVAAACAFGLAPLSTRFGVVPGSAWLVVLAVGLALAASGALQSLAVAGGALGALAGAVLGSVSPAAGGAVLVGLAFAERTSRVRGTQARLLHIGTSLVVGALAGSLAMAYGSASPAVRAVAVVVAAVLVALPLLIDADDPLAHSLEGASSRVSDPARAALRDGAELRRQVQDVPIDAEADRGVRHTWKALLKLADARVRLERNRARAPKEPAGATALAVVDMVDQRIRDHVTALSRAYTAVDTARAAAVGLDDAALKSTLHVGESLEDVSRAMVDVKQST